jgi:hypothetical protein
MIALIIGIFVILLFLVTVVLSVKSWRAWHIVAVCFTFLAAVFFVVVAAMSMKTHMAWRELHHNSENALDREKAMGEQLAYGDPETRDSFKTAVFGTRQKLNRMLIDRGRVWRRCIPGQAQGGTVTVRTGPDDPDPAVEVKPNGIEAKTVLYVFSEGQVSIESGDQPLDVMVPGSYIGEFEVVNADDQNVVLQPTMPLDGLQRQQFLERRPASWALYEMMPLDSHRVFSDEDNIDETVGTEQKPIFGQMNADGLRFVFGTVFGNSVPPEVLDQIVSNYVRDGSVATPEVVNARPENLWVKLEFLKDHKERVDSNNLDPGLGGNYFDPEGYAEITRLRRGSEAEFKKSDVGIFPYGHEVDQQLVKGLVDAGIAQQIGRPFFVRDLRDYEELFHDIQDKFVKRNEDKRRAERDIAAMQASIQKVAAQSAYRQGEKAKLEEDKAKILNDQEKITSLVASLDSQKTSLLDELSQLNRRNLALTQELTRINDALTDEINRRTAEATAQLQ